MCITYNIIYKFLLPLFKVSLYPAQRTYKSHYKTDKKYLIKSACFRSKMALSSVFCLKLYTSQIE